MRTVRRRHRTRAHLHSHQLCRHTRAWQRVTGQLPTPPPRTHPSYPPQIRRCANPHPSLTGRPSSTRALIFGPSVHRGAPPRCPPRCPPSRVYRGTLPKCPARHTTPMIHPSAISSDRCCCACCACCCCACCHRRRRRRRCCCCCCSCSCSCYSSCSCYCATGPTKASRPNTRGETTALVHLTL